MCLSQLSFQAIHSLLGCEWPAIQKREKVCHAFNSLCHVLWAILTMFFLSSTFAWFPQLAKPRELGQINGEPEGQTYQNINFSTKTR